MLVATQAMTAGAIASNFGTSRPPVSKHLQILVECKLFTQEHRGREIYYLAIADKMKEVEYFIQPFRQMWDKINKNDTKYQSNCLPGLSLIFHLKDF
ncbi:ArsR/SmtB family transcription factor [Sphingobacterium cellulitidis]|uniref:ArsR/SmtB family transcription factor n=1 Tax=Sphingobacterium cellulitidis TaxID=1768011 RepID=UPI00183BA5A9|nr:MULTISPECIES: winged helix-turn-helix domain-containing protein [Sphingobacterium]MBA8987509.1 DNA-binding transcriptional regulator GbsR (MarR family) [Sphingobacterium soli]